MRFADIPGHEEIKERLRQLADTGRIPHALLLEGPPGAGKFALARAFAQYIHCEHRTDSDSCGKCPSCLQHQTFNHIDTVFSFPVVKRIGPLSDDYIPEFREFLSDSPFMDFEQWLLKLDNINSQPAIYVDEANDLIRKLSYTTHSAKYRIVLMWLPERLRDDAANKLLKLIEEPSSDTLFILSSDNPKAILPTIYSRTQRIQVKRYPDNDIIAYMTDHFSMSHEDASETARLAGGNMVDAIKLVSLSKDRNLYLDLFMQLMRKAYTRRVGELKEWAAELTGIGREREMQFFEYCAHMLRENFILNLHIPVLNRMTAPEMDFSVRFSPFINERNAMQLFRVMCDARTDIAANGNGKIINFDVALKVILLLK